MALSSQNSVHLSLKSDLSCGMPAFLRGETQTKRERYSIALTQQLRYDVYGLSPEVELFVGKIVGKATLAARMRAFGGRAVRLHKVKLGQHRESCSQRKA